MLIVLVSSSAESKNALKIGFLCYGPASNMRFGMTYLHDIMTLFALYKCSY